MAGLQFWEKKCFMNEFREGFCWRDIRCKHADKSPHKTEISAVNMQTKLHLKQWCHLTSNCLKHNYASDKVNLTRCTFPLYDFVRGSSVKTK